MIEVRKTDWMAGLRDHRARAKIAERIDRLTHRNPGDVKSVGEGISELRIHYGPGYRVYFVPRGKTLIVLLCGGDKSTQTKDIKTAKMLAANLEDWSMAKKKSKTFPYDSAEYLDSTEAINAYMEEALETDDPAFIAKALGTIARARGMSQIARRAGLSRESLYKALSTEGNPEFGTIIRVMHALGLKFSITATHAR